MDTPPSSEAAPRIAGWSIVYFLNLLVPGFFGFIICKDGGVLGMFLGVGAFFAAVTWAVLRWPRFGRCATLGGIAVALTQFWPMLQIACGSLALNVWNGILPNGGHGDKLGTGALAEVGGFAVTILTGQPLLAAALIVGFVLDQIGRVIGGAPEPAEPVHDER